MAVHAVITPITRAMAMGMGLTPYSAAMGTAMEAGMDTSEPLEMNMEIGQPAGRNSAAMTFGLAIADRVTIRGDGRLALPAAAVI